MGLFPDRFTVSVCSSAETLREEAEREANAPKHFGGGRKRGKAVVKMASEAAALTEADTRDALTLPETDAPRGVNGMDAIGRGGDGEPLAPKDNGTSDGAAMLDGPSVEEQSERESTFPETEGETDTKKCLTEKSDKDDNGECDE